MNSVQQPKREQGEDDQPKVNSVQQPNHEQGENDQINVNSLEHSREGARGT